MTKFNLKVQTRTATGKKNKNLRRQGIVPANIFGKGLDSQSVQVKLQEFDRIYKQAGETTLVYLSVDDETKERPTLVNNIDLDPVTGSKLHIDFHQVNLKEKVTTHVPVEIIGESEAIINNLGSLVNSISEIEVEALPTDLPEAIQFDISSLREVGDHLKVSQAIAVKDVEITTDPELTVVSIAELQKEEELPVAETEEATESTSETKEETPATETPSAE